LWDVIGGIAFFHHLSSLEYGANFCPEAFVHLPERGRSENDQVFGETEQCCYEDVEDHVALEWHVWFCDCVHATESEPMNPALGCLAVREADEAISAEGADEYKARAGVLAVSSADMWARD
jgi:hypothetical protein